MTQNDGDPSVSGGFDLEDDSGFYFGVGQQMLKLLMT